MGYNRRSNVNAIYCILLGVSLIAIIIVAGIFLLKEVGNDSPGQEQSGSNQFSETTAPYSGTQAQIGNNTDVPITGNTGEVTVPTTTAPVQTVQEYDLNSDGVAESVNVVVDNVNTQAIIGVGSLGTLAIALEPIGANAQQHLTVAGINLKTGNRLAAVEYTYANGGMGIVKVHVWKYENNAFVKTSEILYSGQIGNQGFMDAGIIENRVPNDLVGYNAEENKNGYIYERSRAIADMKDLGIRLPFETVGAYAITYDDNVTFFYDANIQ